MNAYDDRAEQNGRAAEVETKRRAKRQDAAKATNPAAVPELLVALEETLAAARDMANIIVRAGLADKLDMRHAGFGVRAGAAIAKAQREG